MSSRCDMSTTLPTTNATATTSWSRRMMTSSAYVLDPEQVEDCCQPAGQVPLSPERERLRHSTARRLEDELWGPCQERVLDA